MPIAIRLPVLLVAISGCAHGRPAAPDPVAMQRSLARVLLDHRAFDQAVMPLRALLSRRPDDAEAHTMLGVVYRERGLFAAAEEELVRAARLDAGAAAPRAELALTYDRAGRRDDAIAEHRLAIARAPEVSSYRNNLGWSLVLAGRPAEAIAALQQALEADPSSRRARNNLGFALGRKGDIDGAARAFADAGPPAEAANNLGLLYEAKGDRARACEAYAEAVALDAELAVATRNRKRLCGARDRAVLPALNLPDAPPRIATEDAP